MRCKKAREFLSLEADGLLPAAAALDLEKHLDACGECRSYRSDLQVGSRLLAATEPRLSENFEWRLQLRLNQALQEAAGRTAYPWVGTETGSWDWLRNFGTAAAVGMAAVLAFALFLGPGYYQTGVPGAEGSRLQGDGAAVGEVASRPTAVASDRLPLVGGRFGDSRLYGAPSQQRVSAGGLLNNQSNSFSLDRGWSGNDIEDLRTIEKLRRDNRYLMKTIYQLQRTLRGMQAQLDTSAAHTLDLKLEP